MQIDVDNTIEGVQLAISWRGIFNLVKLEVSWGASLSFIVKV